MDFNEFQWIPVETPRSTLQNQCETRPGQRRVAHSNPPVGPLLVRVEHETLIFFVFSPAKRLDLTPRLH